MLVGISLENVGGFFPGPFREPGSFNLHGSVDAEVWVVDMPAATVLGREWMCCGSLVRPKRGSMGSIVGGFESTLG